MTEVELRQAPTLLSQLRADLAPFPGRASLTWRIALLCALVSACAMLFMTFEAAISCYLIIFLMKPDPIINIGTALGLIVLVSIIVVLMIYIIQFSVGSPFLQMMTIAVTSFVFLYIGAASQLGEIGGIIALVIAFVLTLVGMAPMGAAVDFGLRYAWYMAAMPMALMAVFNLFLGMSTLRILRQTMLTRLGVAAAALENRRTAHDEALQEALDADNGAVEQQAGFVRILALVGRAPSVQIAADVRASYRLMLAVAALPGDMPDNRRAQLLEQINAVRAELQADRQPCLTSVPADAVGAEQEAYVALGIISGAPEGPVIAPPKVAFFFKDALTNPAYQRFAIKTTAAALICYVIYTSIDWQGIHTALVTCYVAALGSTGETVHKLALRIGGCLIGAAMGIFTILFIMPHIDDIGGLIAMVFFGVLVGAWVSTGPERISYGGVQIALAFLLTVLQGFGPTTSLDTAWDRIAGILLGNVVIYLIFTRIWPFPVVNGARQHLLTALEGLSRLLAIDARDRGQAVGDAARISCEAGKAGEALDLMRFEPSSIRTTPAEESNLRRAQEEIRILLLDIYVKRESQPETQRRVQDLVQAVSG
ncbi:FUSC family protein [Aureimonas fodinaquatilis]|uniref:FUSC family protein n=1 Tax=Aureimonas fodinaquatilis TaxID=2565783 RepID=A0A5B0DQH3_9HYPH|nr:FUSC family protein [Aureimonas fodinaquatilis]KAA0969057.1 FUSC family protein [Aureimonas fodinaquatilis]